MLLQDIAVSKKGWKFGDSGGHHLVDHRPSLK